MHFKEELPALVFRGSESEEDKIEKIFLGYREITRGLKDLNLLPIEDHQNLQNREFLLKLNEFLLEDLFNDEEIFKNFTEPALLSAKSRYTWNFICSRIFPLNRQVVSNYLDHLKQISVFFYFIIILNYYFYIDKTT